MGEHNFPRPTRPDVPLTETPEFKAAVAAAAAEAAAQAVAKVTQALNPAMGADTQGLLQGLALAIAEMSHQGDKRDRPIDPKVLAARQAGQERLDALLMDAQTIRKANPRDPRLPKYHAMSKLNLEHHMIEPYRRDPATKKAIHLEFRYCGEPNDAMVPLNDMAKAIYAEFRASRGNRGDYAKEPRKQVWLSDKGLVIEGAPPVRREIIGAQDETEVIDVGEGPFDPNASHVAVLGTLHKPAKQYNAGAPI